MPGNCVNHPQASAVAVCHGCATALCEPCAQADKVMCFYRKQGSAQLFCRQCGFHDLNEARADEPNEQQRLDQASERRAVRQRGRRAARWGLVAGLLVLLALVWLWNTRDREPVTGVYAVGAGLVQDPELQAVLDQLWMLGAALEVHYRGQGRYPETLDVVAAALTAAVPDGFEFRSEDSGQGYLLLCLRPRRYGMRTVYCSSASKVPVAVPVRPEGSS